MPGGRQARNFTTNVPKILDLKSSSERIFFRKLSLGAPSEHGLDPEEFKGRGLDAHAYIGDEGGALWSDLCKAKGDDIKNKPVSDFLHIKQDIRRHFKYFKTDKDQKHFEKIMIDAYNAPTSIQADEAKPNKKAVN